MRSDSKFSDLAHVVLYTIFGVLFLLLGSQDRAPDWVPYVMAVLLVVSVGYCARGRHEERWKAVLWVVPGILAGILLLIWTVVWVMPTSSVQLGNRFAFTATPMSLEFQDAPAAGGTPLIWSMPGSELLTDLWRRQMIYERVAWVPAPPTAPGAVPAGGILNAGPGAWAIPRRSAVIAIPIWWPIGMLGGPTVLWGVVIFVMWARRRAMAAERGYP